MKNILLTGADGFIGSALYGYSPESFRIVTRRITNQYKDVFRVSSIDQYTNWDGAFEGIDTIIHLAGLAHSFFSENEYEEVNVQGTLRLASKAYEAGVRRFVYVSSIAVNGASIMGCPFSSESLPQPHSLFSKSKYRAELLLRNLERNKNLEVVIVRPTLVYGPNAPGNFGLLIKLVEKLPILPFGLSNNCRNFISIQNLVDLLITCATHPNAVGHTFLASDGKAVSIKEFTDAIAEGIGKKVYQLPIPVTLMKLFGNLAGKKTIVEQLLGNLEVDSSNIKQILDWTPPYTMKQSMASLRDLGK